MQPMSEAAYTALAVLIREWPLQAQKDALPDAEAEGHWGTERAKEIDNRTARQVAVPILEAMQSTGASLTDCREAFGAWLGSNTQAGRAPVGWDELICEQFRWLIC